jgi:chromosomal replication initiation ATPase DnaA
MTDLDPKFTFDTFVIGPANRLAGAAARRAADAPGTSYNPLFVYSASGLGKSHILVAIAHQALKSAPDRKVEYMALEEYLAELTEALESGERDGFKDHYSHLEILLLDDVQFLAGQPEAQEMLLRTLDQLSTAGSQIVLASDRPPAEINGLDARLLSRFSGGLIVDIGAPEFETRVAIIRKKAEARGQVLDPGVAEALGKFPFTNVRELGGSLNKVFATQDLEGRQVTPDEITAMMGETKAQQAAGGSPDEFGSFLSDLASTVAETVEMQEEDWRKEFRDAVGTAEREGYLAKRIAGYVGGEEPDGWAGIVADFLADIQRLREIDSELDRLGNPWPDAAEGLLKDPDRLDEAETLLTSVRERQRPFKKLGEGPSLSEVSDYPKMAVRAAQQLVADEKPEYNPVYVWAEKSELGRTLLGAAGRTFQESHPEARMAVTSVQEFAQDFIRALGEGVAGAWRERWWTVDLLLVHGIQELSETERAQDECFHLFDALKRRGARVLLAADRAPARIEKIDERFRSRFEGGLVVEIDAGAGKGNLELVEAAAAAEPEGIWGASEGPIPPLEEIEVGDHAGMLIDKKEAKAPAAAAPTASAAPASPTQPAAPAEPPKKGGAWFPSAENVVIYWPEIDDLLQEELD